MRVDDACIVNTDVTRSDDFYREVVGLERRMRNVRFADFVLGESPRLAMWMRPSIAETVGESFPAAPGMPFRIVVELESPAAVEAVFERAGTSPTATDHGDTIADPDGFLLTLRASADGERRMSQIDLTVANIDATATFYDRLGFLLVERDATSASFDGGNVLVRIWQADASADATRPSALSPTAWAGGQLMLAIELDSGEAVDQMYTELRSRGLVDSGPPAVYEWGARSAYFIDGDGYIWEIYAWVETPK